MSVVKVTTPVADTFVLHNCPECGSWFAVPAQRFEWYQRGIGTAKTLHCPNGHSFIRSNPDPAYRINYESGPAILIRVEAKMPDPPAPPAPADAPGFKPNVTVQCPDCGRKFHNDRGLAMHQRRWCKAAKK